MIADTVQETLEELSSFYGVVSVAKVRNGDIFNWTCVSQVQLEIDDLEEIQRAYGYRPERYPIREREARGFPLNDGSGNTAYCWTVTIPRSKR